MAKHIISDILFQKQHMFFLRIDGQTYYFRHIISDILFQKQHMFCLRIDGQTNYFRHTVLFQTYYFRNSTCFVYGLMVRHFIDWIPDRLSAS